MKPNELDFLSDDALDLLIDLVARVAYERIDPMDPRQGPFFDWMAREARRRLTGAERRELDRQAEVFAERILRRVAAEREGARHQVRCVNEAPRTYVARDGSIGEEDGRAEPTAPRYTTLPRWDLAVAAGIGRELWDEPPSDFVELPDDVDQGRYIALSVVGNSMAPLLHTGDTILVKLGPELKAGHVVVARHPEHGYVVKQVGRVSSMRIELTSLNPDYAPLEIPNDAALVLGTVVLRWHPHG
jgi:SOS-response transcriptional repressor LexA